MNANKFDHEEKNALLVAARKILLDEEPLNRVIALFNPMNREEIINFRNEINKPQTEYSEVNMFFTDEFYPYLVSTAWSILANEDQFNELIDELKMTSEKLSNLKEKIRTDALGDFDDMSSASYEMPL